MKKHLAILGIVTGVLFTISTTWAGTQQAETKKTEEKPEEKTFSIEYASNSPMKDISLKNAKLKGVVYYYGNPKGITEVTTDDNQNFSFKYGDGKATVLSLVAIDGENKAHAECYGTLLPKDTKLLITCKPNKKG